MMADSDSDKETVQARPSVREVIAFTDQQLLQLLAENHNDVHVRDPENISSELFERLRYIAAHPDRAPTSRAIDLDQVSARLQATPVDAERFNRLPSWSETPTPPPPTQEEHERSELAREKDAYHELIKAGGRPPVPLHLLEDFFWDAKQFLGQEKYHDVVSFWRFSELDDKEYTLLCRCTLSRWRQFREAQRLIRDNGFKTERSLMSLAGDVFYSIYPKELAGRAWAGQWGFREYAETIQKRLRKYGFTRPFHLKQDVKQQDKMTTWIEYLGQEYYYYDYPASVVLRGQESYDEAWKHLVDSNLLRPDETSADVIFSYRNVGLREFELFEVQEAIQNATASINSTEEAMRASHAPTKLQQEHLAMYKTKLVAAEATYATIKARQQAIKAFEKKTAHFLINEEHAEQHRHLIRWIEMQLPCIESELSCSTSAESGVDDVRSGKDLAQVHSPEPSKAQSSREERPPGLSSTDPSGVDSQGRQLRKRKGNNTADRQVPPKRPKNDKKGIMTESSATDTPSQRGRKQESKPRSRKPLPAPQPLRRSPRIAKKMQEAAMAARGQPPTH